MRNRVQDRKSQSGTILHRLQSHRASGMILAGRDGPMAAPLQSTDALLRVTGNTVRGTVRQRFLNAGRRMAGRHLPVPAAGRCGGRPPAHESRRPGDRRTDPREGGCAARIRRRGRQGQRATLVEQKRPNAFSTHVANIAPGAVIEIEIEYQQSLALRDGAWRLRFPGVARAPHRTDAGRLDGSDDADAQGAGSALAADPGWQPPRMPRASCWRARRTRPRGRLRTTRRRRPQRSAARLRRPGRGRLGRACRLRRHGPAAGAGAPSGAQPDPDHRGDRCRACRSCSRCRRRTGSRSSAASARARPAASAIACRRSPATRRRRSPTAISTSNGRRPPPACRRRRCATSAMATATTASSSSTRRRPGLGAAARLPRELTFVVDTSGSMGGESIEQARSALRSACSGCRKATGSTSSSSTAPTPACFRRRSPASPASLRLARRHVGRTCAPTAAPRCAAPSPRRCRRRLAPGHLGQVVFITDGAVDYEDELVSLVRERLRGRRLFTVGIGSAPNGFFMRKAAEIGGGTFTYIGNTSEVERRMARLFEKIAHPVSTDLAVTVRRRQCSPSRSTCRVTSTRANRWSWRRGSAQLPRAITVSGVAGSSEHGATAGASGAGRRSARLRPARALGAQPHRVAFRFDPRGPAHGQAAGRAARPGGASCPRAPSGQRLHQPGRGRSHAGPPGRCAAAACRRTGEPAGRLGPPGADRQARTGHSGAALARTATPAPLQLAIGLVLLALGFLLLLSRRGSRLLAAGTSGNEAGLGHDPAAGAPAPDPADDVADAGRRARAARTFRAGCRPRRRS